MSRRSTSHTYGVGPRQQDPFSQNGLKSVNPASAVAQVDTGAPAAGDASFYGVADDAGGGEPEARQALANLKTVLEAAGSSLDRVVKATIYLVDMGDFAAVNAIYADFFGESPPVWMFVSMLAVFVGVAMVNFGGRRAAPAPPDKTADRAEKA